MTQFSDTMELDAASFTAAALAFGEGFTLEAGLLVEKAMRDSVEVVRRNVVKRVRRHRRTGRLERQITVAEAGAGWDLAVRLKSGGPVAHLITGGVRAHAIKSTRPMPISKGAGVLGFAQVVQHPGFRGDPYFHLGFQESIPAVNTILADSGKVLVAQLKEQL